MGRVGSGLVPASEQLEGHGPVFQLGPAFVAGVTVDGRGDDIEHRRQPGGAGRAIEQPKVFQMGIAIAHHHRKGDLLEEAVKVLAWQLELFEQLGDGLIAALIFAIGQGVPDPQAGERGDVLESEPFDASVIPMNEVEAIEHQQLAIVGQREFGGCDAGFPGGAQAQIFVGRELWIGGAGGFDDQRWHGHRGAIGNHDLGLHAGDSGTRAQIGADQLGKDLGGKGQIQQFSPGDRRRGRGRWLLRQSVAQTADAIAADERQQVHGRGGLFGEQGPDAHEEVALGQVLIHAREEVAIPPGEPGAGGHQQGHGGLVLRGRQVPEFVAGCPQ